MLKNVEDLQKGFTSVSEKTLTNCTDAIEKIRELTFFSGIFFTHFYAFQKEKWRKNRKWGNSLYHTCLLEMFRTSGAILFLSINGLYRNAFDSIRHALESIVQSIYVDSNHPDSNLLTKIEILKEIEDRREYHAVRLIDELKIGHKDVIKIEYKELSKLIHPSHKEVLCTIRDIKEKGRGIPTFVDCEEISKIYDSMKRMYDIFYFITLNYLPEFEENLIKDERFKKSVKKYEFKLLSETLKC